jgi:hypothetical protein
VTWRRVGRQTTPLRQCSLSAIRCERLAYAHQRVRALSDSQWDRLVRCGCLVQDQTDAGIFLQIEHSRQQPSPGKRAAVSCSHPIAVYQTHRIATVTILAPIRNRRVTVVPQLPLCLRPFKPKGEFLCQ